MGPKTWLIPMRLIFTVCAVTKFFSRLKTPEAAFAVDHQET